MTFRCHCKLAVAMASTDLSQASGLRTVQITFASGYNRINSGTKQNPGALVIAA